MNKKGFTLIELLTVISIIGTLSTVVISSLGSVREKARITKAISEIKSIQASVFLYNSDTNNYPECFVGTCTALNDPMLNANGIDGWNGPYGSPIYNKKHPWGGHFTLRSTDNFISGPEVHSFIYFDDDAPESGINNNEGVIPQDSLIAIDEAIDDGNLSTGRFISVGTGWLVPGEGAYFFDL